MKKEEILKQYGGVKLKFSSYYKYTFTFKGVAEDGATITANTGAGDSDDIYRMEVEAEKEETLYALIPDFIDISKDGKSVATWDDY
jgi:hypothetical protein